MIHHCFAQPTLLSDHQVQGLQSQARNHVLASLGSKCHEPLCTPDRLRTSSYQTCTLHPRMNEEHRVQHIPMDPVRLSSQEGFQISIFFPVVVLFGWVLLPRRFVSVIVLSHLQSRRFLLPKAVVRSCLCASPGPGMTRSLMTVRRCRMSHQRSRVPAHGCSRVSVSIHVQGLS